MVVTGIFNLEDVELTLPPARTGFPRAQPRHEIYEEKVAEYETLVAVRAEDLRQAMLLSDLLSQAGAQRVEIDAEAA